MIYKTKFSKSHENPTDLTPRRFLAAACAGPVFSWVFHSAGREKDRGYSGGPGPGAPEGLDRGTAFPYYVSLGKGQIRGTLCPRNAKSGPGGLGDCQVRENRQGSIIPWSTAIPVPSTWTPWKENLFPRTPGQPLFFHRHRRLQSPLQVLPELGNLPGRPEETFNL